MDNDKLLNQIEVCKMLDISYPTLIRWRLDEDMKFPLPKKIGKMGKFFSRNEINE